MEKIETSLSKCFEQQVSKTPDAIAWCDAKQKITYQALNEYANQLAHYLKEEGMVPYTFVAIYGRPSLEALIAMLAVIKAGGVYVGLSTQNPRYRQEKILQDLNPAFILCTENKMVISKANAKLIFLQALQAILQNYPKNNHPLSLIDEHIATVIYRSDPSGGVAGVMIAQRAIINLIVGQHYIDFSTIKKTLHHSDLSNENVIFEIWGALLQGLTIIPLENENWEKIAAEKMICLLNTYQYEKLVETHPGFIRNCDCILLKKHGSEKDPTILSKKIIFVYGPIESTVFACYAEPSCEMKTLNNVKVYFLDKKLKPVKREAVGEMYIGGMGLSKGYYNHPELTQERFVYHNEERLYRTGMKGALSEKGVLHLEGRFDREIMIQGELVCPEEIEAILKEAPDVDKAYVMLEENNQHVELNAYFSLNQDSVRIPYEGACKIVWEDGSLEEVKINNISKTGVSVTGTQKIIIVNEKIDVIFPEIVGEESVSAEAVWQSEKTIGLHFIKSNHKIQDFVDDFFRKNKNVVPQKRNIKKFIEKKLPSYMLPTHVIALAKMPLIKFDEVDKEALKKAYQFSQTFSVDEQLKCEGSLNNEIEPIPNVSRHQLFPLSMRQQQTINAENLAIKISLTEKINQAQLKKVIEKLQMRHEMLSVQYAEEFQGKMSQHVIKNVKFDFQTVDADVFSDKIQSFIDEPFDVKKGPLYRVIGGVKKDSINDLLMVFHQGICDHCSLNIIVRDMLEMIRAEIGNKKPNLPVLPIQYLDYIVWKQEEENRIVSSSPRACLKKIPFKINVTITSALIGYANNAQVALSIVLLSAFYALWSRIVKKNEFAIEAFKVDRDREDLKNIVGNFEKSFIVQSNATDDTTFKEMMKKCQLGSKNNDAAIGFYFIEHGLGEYLESSFISYDIVLRIVLNNNQIEGSLACASEAVSVQQMEDWNKSWILTLQKITSNPDLVLSDIL